ncbi:hypothetical protein QL285_049802 [Trifolium repens]|nr:hypothetical protein QL285_049802 [Trifolium repens]
MSWPNGPGPGRAGPAHSTALQKTQTQYNRISIRDEERSWVNNKPKPNTITAPADKKKKEQIEEQNNKAHAVKQRQEQKQKSYSHAFYRAPFTINHNLY